MQEKVNIKHALNERDGFQVWWRLLRPHTLTASIIPVFFGSMIAWTEGPLNVPLFLAMLLAAVLIQAATNMFNEYYDHKRGLDTEHSVGIGGTIVRDGIKPQTILYIAFSFFAIAIILGIYITLASSLWIAVIGLFSMIIGYLYTGGPLPIAYTPFGELFAGFLMGTVMISISYFIQTLTLNANVIWLSVPIAIFIGSILLSNNIRDLDGDERNGRKTIAILIGRKNAVLFLALLFILAYGFTAYFIIVGMLPLYSLIVFVSIFKAIEVIRGFHGKTEPIEMMPAMVNTGKTNTIYGLLLGLSLFISKLF